MSESNREDFAPHAIPGIGAALGPVCRVDRLFRRFLGDVDVAA